VKRSALEKPAILYSAKCRISDKEYVGVTTSTLNKRWGQHCRSAQNPKTRFHHAIKKHGAESFDVVALFVYPTMAEAIVAEEMLIANLDLTRRGYNAHEGGFMPPSMRGYKMSDAEREANRQRGLGKVKTAETRAKLSAALTGRARSAAARQSIAAGHARIKDTAEYREQRRRQTKNAYANKPGYREQVAAATKAAWADPVKRAARLAAMAEARQRKLSSETLYTRVGDTDNNSGMSPLT
jgi:group I intron endonuclease